MLEQPEDPGHSGAPTSVPPSSTASAVWPFVAYMLLLELVGILGFAGMGTSEIDLLWICLFNLMLAQVALASVIGGLMGNNWLEGIFLSAVTVLSSVVAFKLATGAAIQANDVLNATAIPFLCLAGSLPLILLRWSLGWRLCPQAFQARARSRLTIEDMIVVPACIVAFCVMALAPLYFDHNDSNRVVGISLTALLPVYSLLYVVPSTYWAFRIEDTGLRWALCIGYPFTITVVAMVCTASISGGLPGRAMGLYLASTLLSSSISMVGLQILYSCGYRLKAYKRDVPQEELGKNPTIALNSRSPFDLEESSNTVGSLGSSLGSSLDSSNRKRHRIAAGLLLAGSAMVNSGVWIYSQASLRNVLEKIVREGGKVETVSGKPIRIVFGPLTNERTLWELPPMSSVKSISLAGTQVRSLFLRDNFQSLETLDIRNTQLQPSKISVHHNIVVLVGADQFTDEDLQEFPRQGMSVKLMD